MNRIFYGGKEVEFEDFTGNMKHGVKLDLISGQESEGIWAVLQEEDFKDYQKDVIDRDRVRIARLANKPIFVALPWGTYVPYKLNGKQRPTCETKNVSGEVITNFDDFEG